MIKVVFKFLFFVLIVFASDVYAQPPSITFEKSFGSINSDIFYDLYYISDSSIVFIGETNSSDSYINNVHGGYEVWMLRTDINGNLLWNKCFGGLDSEDGRSIKKVGNNFVIGANAGYNDGDVSGIHTPILNTPDYWIFEIDSIGNFIWKNCYGGSGEDNLYSITSIADHGVFAIGSSNSHDYDVVGNHIFGGEDIWALKLDSLGSIKWSKCFGGNGGDYLEHYRSCIESQDGNYLIVGSTDSNDGDVSGNHGGNDVWVVKIDTAGQVIWQRCYGGSGLDIGKSIMPSDHNGFYITGITNSQDGDVNHLIGNGDFWLLKGDSLGNIIWENCYGGQSVEDANTLCATRDGGVVLAGYCFANDSQVTGTHGNRDMWIVKVDSTGNFEWGKALGGSQDDEANAIAQTADGGYIIGGYTNSNDGDVSINLGDIDAWVIRLSPPGLSIKDPQYDIMDLSVLQNENSITIRFFSRKSEAIDLIIYNLEGQVIAQKTVKVSIGVNYFEAPMEFTTGNYILNVTNNYFTTSKKFYIK